MVVGDKNNIETSSRRTHQHPLDPLSYEEINISSEIVKSKANLGTEILFETIVLREPDKELIMNWKQGQNIPRESFLVVLNYKEGKVYELTISLDAGEILTLEHIPDVQPAFMFGDVDIDRTEWEHKIRHDPKFVEALSKRGIDNPDLVMIDPWPISNFGEESEKGKRLAIGRCWVRREETDNGYARPIEGLSPILDLNKSEIMELQDFGVVPIPPNDGNYAARYQSDFRTDIKPIEITQPEGPSFEVKGNHVKWQKW